MPTTTLTAVVRPYRTEKPRLGVWRARGDRRVFWRQGRAAERFGRHAFVCRWCRKAHHDTGSYLPTDPSGTPLMCWSCDDWKLARKISSLEHCTYKSHAKREFWFDRVKLYAIARLYLQEYDKWRRRNGRPDWSR